MNQDIPYEYFELDPTGQAIDMTKQGQAVWTFMSADKEFFPDRNCHVFLRCPNCCMWSHLWAHSVTVEGVVSPSIWCQCLKRENVVLKNADWHVWGRLIDWSKHIGKPKAANQSP